MSKFKSVTKFNEICNQVKQQCPILSNVVDQLSNEYSINDRKYRLLLRCNRVAKDLIELKIPLKRMILSKEFKNMFGL